MPISTKFLILCLLALTLSSCEKVITETDTDDVNQEFTLAGITTKPANKYNNLFNRYGNGWTGGDATYSVALPDGRTVWMFGDSFLDTVYADFSRPSSALIRNTFVVQTGTNLTTLTTGTAADPQALVSTPDPSNQWYWPGDGTVVGDSLFVFMMYFTRTGGGIFDFAYQRTDLVAFSLPLITEVYRTTVFTDNNIMWGADILEDGGFIYVYGSESVPLTKYLHVMRYPSGNIHGTKEFWNGTSWTSTQPASNVGRLQKQSGLPIDVSAQFAIFKQGTTYRLVTQEGFLGPTIYSWEATSITASWKKRQTAYVTPETGGNLFTYNAWIHPQFVLADGSILMSYNENSLNFLDLFNDARIYRPKFVWVKYL